MRSVVRTAEHTSERMRGGMCPNPRFQLVLGFIGRPHVASVEAINWRALSPFLNFPGDLELMTRHYVLEDLRLTDSLTLAS
jgi:hypothetical protein